MKKMSNIKTSTVLYQVVILNSAVSYIYAQAAFFCIPHSIQLTILEPRQLNGVRCSTAFQSSTDQDTWKTKLSRLYYGNSDNENIYIQKHTYLYFYSKLYLYSCLLFPNNSSNDSNNHWLRRVLSCDFATHFSFFLHGK